MNFKNLVKAFYFVGWFYKFINDGNDNYYIGDCKEIINTLNYNENVYCIENSDGKVTELSIHPSCNIEENIDKILSYDTFEKLIFRYDDYEHEECSRLKYFPDNIENFKNLDYLALNGVEIITKNDTLSIPTSVKELSFGSSQLTQENIDNFERLTNLKILNFDHTIIKDGLNFKSVENLENLKE
eukprot:jgi/Orpsp1_1/1179602/evm.model.c7180000070027.1